MLEASGMSGSDISYYSVLTHVTFDTMSNLTQVSATEQVIRSSLTLEQVFGDKVSILPNRRGVCVPQSPTVHLLISWESLGFGQAAASPTGFTPHQASVVLARRLAVLGWISTPVVSNIPSNAVFAEYARTLTTPQFPNQGSNTRIVQQCLANWIEWFRNNKLICVGQEFCLNVLLGLQNSIPDWTSNMTPFVTSVIYKMSRRLRSGEESMLRKILDYTCPRGSSTLDATLDDVIASIKSKSAYKNCIQNHPLRQAREVKEFSILDTDERDAFHAFLNETSTSESLRIPSLNSDLVDDITKGIGNGCISRGVTDRVAITGQVAQILNQVSAATVELPQRIVELTSRVEHLEDELTTARAGETASDNARLRAENATADALRRLNVAETTLRHAQSKSLFRIFYAKICGALSFLVGWLRP